MRDSCVYVQDFNNWVKKGRGKGRYEAYSPWITTQDCHSHTARFRVPCKRLNRLIHCLSNGERLACLALEWNPRVVEIREQFPLAPIDTLDICSELNLIHPHVQGKNIVMTTDFLVTLLDEEGNESLYAFQVKENEAELDKPRVNAKLTIEQKYWERKGIPWSVVLSSNMKGPRYDNLLFLARYRNTDLTNYSQCMLDFKRLLSEYPHIKLCDLGEVCPNFFGKRYATVCEPVLFLVAHQKLSFDMEHELVLNAPVGEFKCLQ